MATEPFACMPDKDSAVVYPVPDLKAQQLPFPSHLYVDTQGRRLCLQHALKETCQGGGGYVLPAKITRWRDERAGAGGGDDNGGGGGGGGDAEGNGDGEEEEEDDEEGRASPSSAAPRPPPCMHSHGEPSPETAARLVSDRLLLGFLPPEAGAFVDEGGKELCLAFARSSWGEQEGCMRRHKKCRWGATSCHRSHDRPSQATLARLAGDERALAALEKGLVADKVARAAAGRAEPLPQWFHAARRELVFRCDGGGESGGATKGAAGGARGKEAGGGEGGGEGEGKRGDGEWDEGASSSDPLGRMREAVRGFLGWPAARAGGVLDAAAAADAADKADPAAAAAAADKADPAGGDPVFELESLDQIHRIAELPEAPPMCPTLMHAFKMNGRKLPKRWKKAMMRERRMITVMGRHPAYQEFLAAYHDLIRCVVAPLCGDNSGVVYQCPPTLRVVMPSRRATIGMHCDGEYHKHESGEINFWIPLTSRVWDTNTLHAESAPGKGDFRPFNLAAGEALRFNGNECRHYTVPNESDATRVSFDFRVIPRSLYRGDFDGFIGEYKTAVCEGPLEDLVRAGPAAVGEEVVAHR
jgi:hypothetical protein